jgi:hypothetical protein
MSEKITISTPKGKLTAEITRDYPGIVILWDGQQIALIDTPAEAEDDKLPANQLRLLVWDRDDHNDPTSTITITKWEVAE